MSGSAVRRLQDLVSRYNLKMSKNLWRKLKSEYARTPAKEKRKFKLVEFLLRHGKPG